MARNPVIFLRQHPRNAHALAIGQHKRILDSRLMREHDNCINYKWLISRERKKIDLDAVAKERGDLAAAKFDVADGGIDTPFKLGR